MREVCMDSEKNIRINTIMYLLILFTSIVHISMGIILLMLAIEFFIVWFVNHGQTNYNINKNKYSMMIIGAILLIIFIAQFILLNGGIKSKLSCFMTMSVIFIFIPIYAFLRRSLVNFKAYLNSITWFVTLYSICYLLLIMKNGLPKGRNSVFANVSSNYCTALLYISFPIILYGLFAKKDLQNSIKIRSIIAILLALAVIISSGSRTAFGAVAVIFLSLILIFIKKHSLKHLAIGVLIIGLIFVFFRVASEQNELISKLVERSYGVFNLKSEVDKDVRTIIWKKAIFNIKNMNYIWGCGSVLVKPTTYPAHNFVLEILLSTGVVGLVAYVYGLLKILISTFIKTNFNKKFFVMQLIVIFFVIAYVQPFFSTNYACGIILWSSIFAMYFDSKERKEINE